MELRWLRAFVAVVDHGGFSSAASALYLSQSSISGQIGDLERELGATLFVRGRRPVRITQAGEVFLDETRAVLQQLDVARDRVSEVMGLRSGVVSLGTYSSATAGFLPQTLRAFTEFYPGITVRLTDVGGAYIPNLAAQGDVDVFLRQTMPLLSPSEFEAHLLWREDFKVVVPRGHALDGPSTPLQPDELLEHPLILTGKYHPNSLLAHPFWGSLGQRPEIAFEVAHPQSLIALVGGGHGVGVTTELALRVANLCPKRFAVRSIDDTAAVRDVAVYMVRGKTLSPAAEALVRHLLRSPLPPGCRRIEGSDERGLRNTLGEVAHDITDAGSA